MQNRPFLAPVAQTACRWLAVLCLVAIMTGLIVNARHPYLMDFVSYWAAAVMALTGHGADAYDVDLHHAVQQTAFAFDTHLPFAYPPPYLLLIAPIGLIPYPLAAAVWVILSLIIYVAAVRAIAPGWQSVALAFPPVLICGISGQNGLLTAAILIAGLAMLRTRPFGAGLILGCLLIKPQLGLMLPLALLAARDGKAFAGATLSVISLLLLSLLAFGTGPWLGFVKQSALFSAIATDGLVGWHKMASLYATLRLIGVSSTPAFAVHLLGAIFGAMMVWQVWRAPADLPIRAATLAAASLLVSPYLYVYDQVMLIAGLTWLAGLYRGLAVLLFLLPASSIAQYWSSEPFLNLAPLGPLLVLLCVYRLIRRTSAPPDARPHQHALQTARNSE